MCCSDSTVVSDTGGTLVVEVLQHSETFWGFLASFDISCYFSKWHLGLYNT